MLCDFDCGQEATIFFKSSKKWCCSKSTSKCPNMRLKNSKSHKNGELEKLDWNWLQQEYNGGKSVRTLVKETGITPGTFASAIKQDLFQTRSLSDARKLVKTAKHTDDTKKKLSKVAKDRNLGGYVKGSGRGQKGWYKGFFCDSSWELAFVIYYTDHNLAIVRNNEKRQYCFNGQIKNYIPDFQTDEGLVEIKGYRTAEWEAKLAANPDVKVYYENDLTDIFRYVYSKYGKKFVDLYE